MKKREFIPWRLFENEPEGPLMPCKIHGLNAWEQRFQRDYHHLINMCWAGLLHKYSAEEQIAFWMKPPGQDEALCLCYDVTPNTSWLELLSQWRMAASNLFLPDTALCYCTDASDRWLYAEGQTIEIVRTGDMAEMRLYKRGKPAQKTAFHLLLKRLAKLVECAINDEQQTLQQASLYIAEDRAFWDRHSCPYHVKLQHSSVQSLFAEIVARHGNRPAIEEHGHCLTYQELDRASDRTRDCLLSQVGDKMQPIGIALQRSTDLIVAMLGILKAGRPYVPVDYTYPDIRIQSILEDCQPAMILVNRESEKRIRRSFAGRMMHIQEIVHHSWPVRVMHNEGNGDKPAYLIYTSGSTGQPKGVVIPHRGILRLVAQPSVISFHKEDVFLNISSPTFDALTFEVWGALLNGARLVVVDHETILAPEQLISTLRKTGVTTAFFTSSLFNRLVEYDAQAFSTLTHLWVGGEALSVPHCRQALQESDSCLQIINGYGPTENTTFTTFHPLQKADLQEAAIPLGKPVANTKAFVMDTNLNLLPAGALGELCVAGDGLALGYLTPSKGTETSFSTHHHVPWLKGPLYRTGDLVRVRPDGVFEYHGRLDRQVKIRGFRIELAEVEACMVQCAGVRRALAHVWQPANGTKMLIGLYTDGEQRVMSDTLLDHLKQSLPDYMIPHTLIRIDEFPLLAHGKLNLTYISEVCHNHFQAQRKASSGERQLTEVEESIYEGLRLLTSFGNIDRQANFFDIGLDSLMLSRLRDGLRREHNIDIPITWFYTYPTIGALSRHIKEATTSS